MGTPRLHPAALARATGSVYSVDLDEPTVTCPTCGWSFVPPRLPLVPEAVDLASRVVLYVRRRGGVARIRDIYRGQRVTKGTLFVALRVIVERGLGVVVPGRPALFRVFG
jgi:hypothetical protein